jgi:hypothetical protein
MLFKKPETCVLGAASAIALICLGGAAAAQDQVQAKATPPTSVPQLPPRDTSKLPTTFAGAAAVEPSNPAWPQPYKPKSRRDFTGVWERAGEKRRAPPQAQAAAQGQGPARRQGGAQGQGGVQTASLTPPYAAVLKQRQDDRAAGKVTGDPTASCLPGGMPRMMTHSPYPMEIMMNDRQMNIFREYEEQLRRIYTDGRKLHTAPDPTYRGESVGHWNGDVLEATTIGLRDDTNVDAGGTPHSDKLILYERMWLVDDNNLNYEVTLVDPKAFTQPWTETRSWKRADPKLTIMPYLCAENNRNPVGADGATQVLLK